METIAERAERLTAKRARALPALAVIYFAQQASFFAAYSQPHSSTDIVHFKIGAWVILSLAMLAALATKGFWFSPREVRELADDETSRANRSAAMRAAYLVSTAVAIILYLAQAIAPLSVLEAIHLIVSSGLGVGLLTFGMLERKAMRG